ncbi:MAG TPA: hypothetical protein VNB64_07160 [Solirubrobacteraceae bacterium]|nr:hypothetical protein [Solirubrobacteraceae bacterium]
MSQHLRTMVVAALAVLAACALPAAAPAQSDPRPYHLVSPIFTPKDATSFTVLMTSGDDASQSMLLRRYDAVGTLLSSQAVTIGAHGSLQASPVAHSGAPLHIELWSPSPAVMARITYTDSSNVTQRILEEQWLRVGPERGLPAAVAGLQGTAGAIEAKVDGVQGTANAVQGTTSAIQGTVFDVRTAVGGLAPKLDAVAADVSALRGVPSPTPDARVTTLQRDVTRMRNELRSLRRILLRRIPARRR